MFICNLFNYPLTQLSLANFRARLVLTNLFEVLGKKKENIIVKKKKRFDVHSL
jgi:hypothetical protein